TVHGCLELGEAAVGHGLPVFFVAVAATHEVSAAVAQVQAGGIKRDPSNAPAAMQGKATSHCMSEQSTDAVCGEQALASFLERGKVRYSFQVEHSPQFG